MRCPTRWICWSPASRPVCRWTPRWRACAQELELVAPILAHELKQTLLEIQAGVRRSDAFHRLSNRTGVEDLRTLSAMIIQTELFGTSVSRALRVHAEGMRTKRMQLAEEKAAMVSVKMTIPLIMCILPSLFAVVHRAGDRDDLASGWRASERDAFRSWRWDWRSPPRRG